MMLIFRSHYVHDSFGTFDFGGECGVAMFFMLSGFVLALRYGEEIESHRFQHKRFVMHQLTKFYPLHLLCLAFIVATGFRHIDAAYIVKMLPSVVLLQSWIPYESYYFFGNAVSWYLSTLLSIYLFFPAIYRIVNAKWSRLAWIAPLTLFIYGLYLYLVPAESYNGTVYAQPIVRSYDFALGILSARLLPIVKRRIEAIRLTTVVELLPIAAAITTWMLYPEIDNRVHCACLFWPMGMLTLLVYASTDSKGGMVSRALHWQWMRQMGGISFEIFLLHTITLQFAFLIVGRLGIHVNEYLMLSLSIVAVIAVAWMAQRCFVRPVQRRLQSHINKGLENEKN